MRLQRAHMTFNSSPDQTWFMGRLLRRSKYFTFLSALMQVTSPETNFKPPLDMKERFWRADSCDNACGMSLKLLFDKSRWVNCISDPHIHVWRVLIPRDPSLNDLRRHKNVEWNSFLKMLSTCKCQHSCWDTDLDGRCDIQVLGVHVLPDSRSPTCSNTAALHMRLSHL